MRSEKRAAARDEGREQREERSEKREERRSEKRETITIKIRGWKNAKVRSQKGGMVPKRVGPSEGRGKRAEKREKRREKRSQKRPPEIPKLIDSRVCWPLGRLESLHFYRVGGLEAS